MKRFSEFVNQPYDGLIGREKTEWSNLWWDNANSQSDKRYLLIGDSTMRMVRSTFAKLVGCPVDMIGSSSDVDDVLFVSQVDAFFASKQYHYSGIFLQVGHHAHKSRNGGDYNNRDLDRFRNGVQMLIGFLKQYSSCIIIESIFDSVVINYSGYDVLFSKMGLKDIVMKIGLLGFMTRYGIRKEKKDNIINDVTDMKTAVLKEIALNSHYRWLDINALVQQKCFAHIDHIHYENKAKYFIAKEMIKVL